MPKKRGGGAVDTDDHVWVVQRPSSLTDDEAATLSLPRSKCCRSPSGVRAGKLLRSWGSKV
jgi:hypothetical protein